MLLKFPWSHYLLQLMALPKSAGLKFVLYLLEHHKVSKKTKNLPCPSRFSTFLPNTKRNNRLPRIWLKLLWRKIPLSSELEIITQAIQAAGFTLVTASVVTVLILAGTIPQSLITLFSCPLISNSTSQMKTAIFIPINK